MTSYELLESVQTQLAMHGYETIGSHKFGSVGWPGTYFPTNRKGFVGVGLTVSPIFIDHRLDIAWSDIPYAEGLKVLTLGCILVDPRCRRQGLGEAAMSTLCGVCDGLKVKLNTEVCGFETIKLQRDKKAYQKFLETWYAKYGFVRKRKDSNLWVRVPHDIFNKPQD